MRLLRTCSTLLLPVFAWAASAPPPSPASPPEASAGKKEKDSSPWVFSLLPKSLQKNPRLELTVITEMTDAGKKFPPVTPQAPAYFELFTTGPRHLGHAQGNDRTLKQPEVEQLLNRALATNGFLPAQPPAQPPSLLVVYTWGSHNLLVEGDDENPTLSGNQIARNLLDRAALVGGEKFARHLLDLFQQADAMSLAAGAATPPGGQPVITPAVLDITNPVEMFKRSNPKNEFLVDQAATNVYYVVASAYDYKSAATNHRILLWRTRMTVGSDGVSPQQSLPTLVLSAAPFLGREMAEPEILFKRPVPEGNVEVGTPTVIEPRR